MSSNNPKLLFQSSWQGELQEYDSTLIVGKKASVEKALPLVLDPLGFNSNGNTAVPRAILNSLLGSLDDKTGGSPASTLIAVADEKVHRLTVAGLASQPSRHNHPMAVHTLTRLVAGHAFPKGSTSSRLIVLCEDFPVGPLGLAIGKAFSLFSKKTSAGKPKTEQDKTLHITFVKSDGSSVVQDPVQLQAAQVAAKGAQLTARLVDMHPELLTTTQFAKEVEALVQQAQAQNKTVKLTQIVGNELATRGYGGLHGVGKAANCPPRLIVLEYDGSGNTDSTYVETVALVGKGIVFDTGGLSLKPKVGMCGMKHDMGGAAGLLGGFFAAVELGVAKKVVCILCVAENAIGPDAFRNDGTNKKNERTNTNNPAELHSRGILLKSLSFHSSVRAMLCSTPS
jgi:probable aminopeptidase NPEPL1